MTNLSANNSRQKRELVMKVDLGPNACRIGKMDTLSQSSKQRNYYLSSDICVRAQARIVKDDMGQNFCSTSGH